MNIQITIKILILLLTSPKDPDPSLLIISKHWWKYNWSLLESYFDDKAKRSQGFNKLKDTRLK